MPQVQLIPEADREIQVSDNIPFRQRLIDRFKSHEFVKVKNIDDEDIEWFYMPSNNGEESLDIDNQKIVLGRRAFNKDYSRMSPGNEKLWKLEAGKTEVMIGECAYLFIENLFKRIVAKRTIDKVPAPKEYQARNFNWSDITMQDMIIDEIFLGVVNPSFDSPKTAK